MSNTIYHVGISGGKDSAAVLLWLVKESGIPPCQIVATFSNTHNEHQWTYQHVLLMSARIHYINWLEPQLGFFDLAKKKGRFPSAKARFCTQELKMKPSRDFIYSLMDECDEVIAVSGVRAAESTERAKLSEWGDPMESYYGLREWRPILNWSLEDVKAIHRKYSFPLNPLYDAGMIRVGCFPCINSRKEEIRLIAKRFPERIDNLRQMEYEFNNLNGMSTFFARNKVPISQRSKEITTANGERMKVATIDDVVRWAKTSHGGIQYRLDFEDEPVACSSNLGFCE